MANAKITKQQNDTAANFGYEAHLWQMADALQGSRDAAEYKHVILGLIFLKYISDALARRGGAYIAFCAMCANHLSGGGLLAGLERCFCKFKQDRYIEIRYYCYEGRRVKCPVKRESRTHVKNTCMRHPARKSRDWNPISPP